MYLTPLHFVYQTKGFSVTKGLIFLTNRQTVLTGNYDGRYSRLQSKLLAKTQFGCLSEAVTRREGSLEKGVTILSDIFM